MKSKSESITIRLTKKERSTVEVLLKAEESISDFVRIAISKEIGKRLIYNDMEVVKYGKRILKMEEESDRAERDIPICRGIKL